MTALFQLSGGHEAPAFSNTTSSRFLFGHFTLTDDGPAFVGAAIYGTELEFDLQTAEPCAGWVDRLEIQIRSAQRIEATLARFQLRAHVEDLNAISAQTETPWYDPESYPDTDAVSMSEDASAQQALTLGSGDVLTDKDLKAMLTPPKASANSTPSVAQAADLHFIDLDGLTTDFKSILEAPVGKIPQEDLDLIGL